MEGEAPQNVFDTRFQPEKMKLFGGKISVVDIAPETPSDKSRVPLLVAPGCFENPLAYKGPLRVLVDQGRHVLSLSHLRHGGDIPPAYTTVRSQIESRLVAQGSEEQSVTTRLNEFDQRWQELQEAYKPAALRRGLTILSLLEQKNIDQVDGLGRSEGGIDLAIAASLAPEKFRNFILLTSAGMMGDDTFWRLTKRARQQMAEDGKGGKDALPRNPLADTEAEQTLTTQTTQMQSDRLSPRADVETVVNYAASNPARFIGEMRSIASDQVHTIYQGLREKGHGVAMINAVGDKNFPMKTVQEGPVSADRFSEDGQRTAIGSVDGFVSIQGGHNNYLGEPRIVRWADHLLTQLAKKYQQQS